MTVCLTLGPVSCFGRNHSRIGSSWARECSSDACALTCARPANARTNCCAGVARTNRAFGARRSRLPHPLVRLLRGVRARTRGRQNVGLVAGAAGVEAGLPPTQVRVAPALRGLVEHRRVLVEGCAALRPLAEHELWRPKRTAPFVLHHPHLGRVRRFHNRPTFSTRQSYSSSSRVCQQPDPEEASTRGMPWSPNVLRDAAMIGRVLLADAHTTNVPLASSAY